MPLFNLKKLLKIHKYREFSKFFSQYPIFESIDNIFLEYINKIYNIVRNSLDFKGIERFHLRKVQFWFKKEDYELANCLLTCISKEIKYLMTPIYINLTELMREANLFLNELPFFVNLLPRNTQRYIIFIDIREAKTNDIEVILEKTVQLFEKNHEKPLFFLLSHDKSMLFKLFPLKLSFEFSETNFLKLILEIICKNISISDLNVEERSLYFEEKSKFLTGNIKDTYSFILKMINKFHCLNLFKKSLKI